MKRIVTAFGILLSLFALVGPPLPAVHADAFAFQAQILPSFDTQDLVRDFEPAIEVGAPADTVYVAANYHIAGTPTRGVELWSGSFGQALAADGPLNPPLGGLDVDIALGSTGNLYDATEFSPTPHAKTGSYGIGMGTCPAGSIPAAMTTQCYGQQRDTLTHTDRPWIAADGPSTVYLSYHRSFDAQLIPIQRSTDAGRTWTTVGDAIAPSHRHQATDNNLHGPIVVDPASHTVYQVFVIGPQGAKGQGQPPELRLHGRLPRRRGHLRRPPRLPVAHRRATRQLLARRRGRRGRHGLRRLVGRARRVGVGFVRPGSDVAGAATGEPGQRRAALQRGAVAGRGRGGPRRGRVVRLVRGGQPGPVRDVVRVLRRGAGIGDGVHSPLPDGRQPARRQPAQRPERCAVRAGRRLPRRDAPLFDDFGVALSSDGQAAIAYGDATSDPTNPYRIAVAMETAGPRL